MITITADITVQCETDDEVQAMQARIAELDLPELPTLDALLRRLQFVVVQQIAEVPT